MNCKGLCSRNPWIVLEDEFVKNIYVFFLFDDVPLRVYYCYQTFPGETIWDEMSLNPAFKLPDLSKKTLNETILDGYNKHKGYYYRHNIIIAFWNTKKWNHHSFREFRVIN